jgi:hypothetical protein
MEFFLLIEVKDDVLGIGDLGKDKGVREGN